MDIVNVLLWAGTIAGGLMVLLLLVSMLSGVDMDFDGDFDFDSGDADIDGDINGGGLGLVKSVLTFISVGSFTARAIALNSTWSWWMAMTAGVISGLAGVIILGMLLKLLLNQQEEGNYAFWDAEGKTGKVYVSIPKNGFGKVTVDINGAYRELPAKSDSGKAISSGKKVMVLKAEEDHLLVEVI